MQVQVRSDATVTVEEADGLLWAVLTAKASAGARIYVWNGEAGRTLPNPPLPDGPVALSETLVSPTTIANEAPSVP